MVFERKIYKKLLEWKEVSHGQTAVMLEGARRIGKSTIVETFAKKEYEDYLLLDFAKESKDVKQNFIDNIGDMDTFFRNLFLLKGKELPQKKSVIIFDEVQLFPPARQAIKYLVQDGRFDYMETGSLISIKKNVQDILIPSEEYKLKMYPMDFEEFLWAKSDRITAAAIRDAFAKRKPLGDAIHRKIMQTFRTYLVVGGMPQAVQAFVEGKSYKEIDFVKRNILSLYEADLRKYDDDNREKASVIFKTIPEQLENHNSHFRFSLVDKNARYKNYVDAVNFVAESMIGNECIGVTAPEVSLEAYADRSNFKLYMGDTGLLVTQMMKNSDEHGICLLVVHHTRKMESSDSFDMISGTNGLLGAADGAFVMQKEKRTDNKAVLEVAGRDQQDQRLLLDLDREQCVWKLTKAETELWKEPADPILEAVAKVVSEKQPLWSGTASELLQLLPDLDMQPNVLTRKLNIGAEQLFVNYGIRYASNREHSGRMIKLELVKREA